MLPRRPFPPGPPRQFPMPPFSPNQPMMNRPSGGILSRLFGGKTGAMSNMTNASQMNSMLGNASHGKSGVSSIGSMMTNVQKALKMAETVGPMVQQYGPMVRNIPAMFKIYQALKNDDSSEEISEAETPKDEKGNGKQTSKKGKVNTENGSGEETFNELELEFVEKRKKGSSKPKLYI